MKLKCKHCGISYRSHRDVDGFCCRGCAHVYALIQQEGLEGFYGEQSMATRPVGERPFEARDYTWTLAEQDTAEAEAERPKAAFRLTGMSCVGCVWLVERLARRAPGAVEAKASLTGQLLRVEWERGAFDLAGLAETLHRFGYDLAPGKSVGSGFTAMDWRMLLSIIFALNAGLLAAPQWLGGDFAELASLLELLLLVCMLLSLLVGGSYCFLPWYRGWQLRRLPLDGLPGLVAAGVFIAVLFDPSQRWFFPIVICLMLLSEWFAWRTGVLDRALRWPMYQSGLLVVACGLAALGVLSALFAAIGYAVAGICVLSAYVLLTLGASSD